MEIQQSLPYSKKMPLGVWFAIFYAMPVVGGISRRFNTAKNWSLVSGESQLSIVVNEISTPAGIIDSFIYPSLASAITITFSIFFYRRTVIKLKQRSRKPLLVITFVLSTLAIWTLLSVALALILS